MGDAKTGWSNYQIKLGWQRYNLSWIVKTVHNTPKNCSLDVWSSSINCFLWDGVILCFAMMIMEANYLKLIQLPTHKQHWNLINRKKIRQERWGAAGLSWKKTDYQGDWRNSFSFILIKLNIKVNQISWIRQSYLISYMRTWKMIYLVMIIQTW